MGKIGHCYEKMSHDHRVSSRLGCPLKTGFTVLFHMIGVHLLPGFYMVNNNVLLFKRGVLSSRERERGLTVLENAKSHLS